MIHEIGVEIQTRIETQGCPFKVVDGPEATKTATFGRERIVIEHDGQDGYVPPRSQSLNPPLLVIRNIAIKFTIYAKSPAAGATPFEHRRRLEHVLDVLTVAVIETAANRKNAIKWSGGGFFQPTDLEGSEIPGGAAYELKLSWERGVTKRTWAGAAADEAVLDVLTTDVSAEFGDLSESVAVVGTVPTLSGISPSGGSIAGGTLVTLTGTYLESVSSIQFDGDEATSVTPAVDGLSATCLSPAHAAGIVSVTASEPNGDSSTLADAFTYSP